MVKKILAMVLSLALFTACQDEEVVSDNLDEVTVDEISAASLPSSSIAFIEENFVGEVVTSAYVLSDEESTNYEAFLTDGMNLVFSSDGSLEGFGEEASLVDCGGRLHRLHGNRFGDHRPPNAAEVNLEDLPANVADYLTTNYPDGTLLKAIFIDHEDVTQYHMLIREVGAVIFDVDGNFLQVRERPERTCGDFVALTVEELPTAVTDYIIENYPENEILRARTGTRDEVVEIHALVEGVGALIFDENGIFLELKTCGMDR
ncbi:PepSY-like domain-containing protein [Xanthovirga aplysinae]|uniref:PepSY-like domain-containing protein n=1 Tax=Xanthovirga aplysinae TaxID=2529853 RepID=UPI0012BCFE2B|nr:PepSY-like domain-containing protein [Xanthovirga aplysinae]MTI32763.1 hypothetical protein [Xanthovirga aplysinae]